MHREIVERAINEAREAEANLVVWDRRDTFTLEQDDLSEIEVTDDHLRVRMQEGKAVVYVELESVFKVVVEKERVKRAGLRAGFGSASG